MRTLVSERRFQHDGKEYEIRLYETRDGWTAEVLHAGILVSPIEVVQRFPVDAHLEKSDRIAIEWCYQEIEAEFKRGTLSKDHAPPPGKITIIAPKYTPPPPCAAPHQEAAKQVHILIIICTTLVSFACIGGGIVAICLNAKSKTEFQLLGAHLTTGHVGVALVGIGRFCALFVCIHSHSSRLIKHYPSVLHHCSPVLR